MAKTPNINKVIKEILDGQNLEYLIKKIHYYWHSADEIKFSKNNLLDQKVNRTIPSKGIRSSATIEKPIESKTEVIPVWALSLEEQYQLMNRISSISDIACIFSYNASQDVHINLLRFITRSADWVNVVNIWNTCASQCKHTQEHVSKEYFEVLDNALYLYNLTLSDKKASLKSPAVGDIYDYNLHHEIAGGNKNITKVLLPALYSASNKIDKTALVIT